MTIRAYSADDFATVQTWAESRGIILIPQLLGNNGFLIEDEHGPLLVAFAYLLFDVPIVQIDHLLGREGADIGAIREAWEMIQSAVVEWIKAINESGGYEYRVIRGFTSPQVAREAEKNGWLIDNSPLKCIRYVIP